MIEKLQAFLYRQLSRRSFKSDNAKFLFLISYAACFYATGMQLFLLFFYLAVGILPLLFASICLLLIDMLLFRLVRKGHYTPFGILISVTVIIFTMLTAICIGSDNFVILYLFVPFVMQVIIPYASVRARVLMAIALWACMISLIFIQRYMTPVCDIGEANFILTMFNIHLAIFGIAIQLTAGNIIWDVITKFRVDELKKFKIESHTDPLTGLFNRRYADIFFEKLKTGQAEQKWCVAILDIDDFKLINDTYGHHVGDGVLVLISNIVKTSLRKTDLVFRWGGEEFLILLKDVDISVAFHILNKIRGNLASENLETHGKILKLTVTIGSCPLDIHNVEQSIEICDRLMYQGKNSGKNVVII
jgi:diguanylate cyclase (GGDEF)-like protein